MNKTDRYFIPCGALLLGFALLGPVASDALSKDAATKAGGHVVSPVPTVAEIALPQSIFVIPSQPSEGRNPFFPQSTTQVVAPIIPKGPSTESFTFFLNGITSPPKRTAMINNRTFEPGEEGEVRMPNGAKVLIKCEEIKPDSAVISVSGQRRELKLRSGL